MQSTSNECKLIYILPFRLLRFIARPNAPQITDQTAKFRVSRCRLCRSGKGTDLIQPANAGARVLFCWGSTLLYPTVLPYRRHAALTYLAGDIGTVELGCDGMGRGFEVVEGGMRMQHRAEAAPWPLEAASIQFTSHKPLRWTNCGNRTCDKPLCAEELRFFLTRVSCGSCTACKPALRAQRARQCGALHWRAAGRDTFFFKTPLFLPLSPSYHSGSNVLHLINSNMYLTQLESGVPSQRVRGDGGEWQRHLSSLGRKRAETYNTFPGTWWRLFLSDDIRRF
jgi:hypothetical protein